MRRKSGPRPRSTQAQRMCVVLEDASRWCPFVRDHEAKITLVFINLKTVLVSFQKKNLVSLIFLFADAHGQADAIRLHL